MSIAFWPRGGCVKCATTNVVKGDETCTTTRGEILVLLTQHAAREAEIRAPAATDRDRATGGECRGVSVSSDVAHRAAIYEGRPLYQVFDKHYRGGK